MHLAVLGNPDSWYLADLRRAAADRHGVTPVAFERLASSLAGREVIVSAGEKDCRRFDALLLRTMPAGSLQQIIFRMDVLGRLEASGVPVVNPPRAVEAAVDKYLTSARLQEAGLRVPRTMVCQTIGDALAAFDALGGDVVVKPLFGSEGRGIERLTSPQTARRVLGDRAACGDVLYLQEFLAHEGCDLRLLVVGSEVLAIRRCNPHDWRTNVSRGARVEPFAVDDVTREMALRAAAAVGAPLAGVDLLPCRDGHLYAVEVNAVPGWKALAAAHRVDVAARVLALLERLAGAGAAV